MTDTPDSARVRRQQILIWALGLAVAATMVALGLWQMQVFRNQGKSALLARMHQPSVALTQVANTTEIPRDAYGRTVDTRGTYLAGHDLMVPLESGSGCRVLTPLQLEDGTVLPVVRGVSSGCTAPPVPPGVVAERGVFLPSEAEPPREYAGALLGSVRLPRLPQLWAGQLMPGFLTLDGQHSAAQGLPEATVTLPDTNAGQARNSGYALQWWIFAAAALGATVKLSRDSAGQTGFMRRREVVDTPVDTDGAAQNRTDAAAAGADTEAQTPSTKENCG